MIWTWALQHGSVRIQSRCLARLRQIASLGIFEDWVWIKYCPNIKKGYIISILNGVRNVTIFKKKKRQSCFPTIWGSFHKTSQFRFCHSSPVHWTLLLSSSCPHLPWYPVLITPLPSCLQWLTGSPTVHHFELLCVTFAFCPFVPPCLLFHLCLCLFLLLFNATWCANGLLSAMCGPAHHWKLS